MGDHSNLRTYSSRIKKFRNVRSLDRGKESGASLNLCNGAEGCQGVRRGEIKSCGRNIVPEVITRRKPPYAINNTYGGEREGAKPLLLDLGECGIHEKGKCTNRKEVLSLCNLKTDPTRGAPARAANKLKERVVAHMEKEVGIRQRCPNYSSIRK